MKRLLLFTFVTFLLCSFTTQDKNKTITIYMIGDSTMANKSLKGGNVERGWGQMLSGFFKSDKVSVENHALNGRSSKSFIDEGLWDKVISKVQQGDYVFVEFGHNDEKPDSVRHTDPGSTFDDNLRRFVNETRSKGGIPVLFNAITRRHFEGDSLIDTHGTYLESPRQVAKELNVTFIDLNRATSNLVQQLGNNASKSLYVWVPAHTLAACPNGREDNTHLNIYGARQVTGLAVDSIEQKIPELAPFIQRYDYVVAKDGSGNFFSIQDAVNAVPDFRKKVRTTILVCQGVYKEKLIIPTSKMNISMIGEEGAVISYDDYASKKNVFGDEKSTSGSSSCYIYAPNFYAENITFENTSGPVGQAVACFVSGDRAHFKHCRFKGFQDTLYTYGKNSRQYYEGCYIEGTVDFIFGWSTAVFNNCEIHSIGNGYLTAPATDKDKQYGYVFYDCNITASNDADKVYLSRPWRPYAKAVFIRCHMDKHIVPEGWHNWDSKAKEKTVTYAEFQSTGEGANPEARSKFASQLKSLKTYSPEEVLAGTDGWNPIKNGNAITSKKR